MDLLDMRDIVWDAYSLEILQCAAPFSSSESMAEAVEAQIERVRNTIELNTATAQEVLDAAKSFFGEMAEDLGNLTDLYRDAATFFAAPPRELLSTTERIAKIQALMEKSKGMCLHDS
jgi:hypothetical protein